MLADRFFTGAALKRRSGGPWIRPSATQGLFGTTSGYDDHDTAIAKSHLGGRHYRAA
jgi:hypothetical protein